MPFQCHTLGREDTHAPFVAQNLVHCFVFFFGEFSSWSVRFGNGSCHGIIEWVIPCICGPLLGSPSIAQYKQISILWPRTKQTTNTNKKKIGTWAQMKSILWDWSKNAFHLCKDRGGKWRTKNKGTRTGGLKAAHTWESGESLGHFYTTWAPPWGLLDRL